MQGSGTWARARNPFEFALGQDLNEPPPALPGRCLAGGESAGPSWPLLCGQRGSAAADLVARGSRFGDFARHLQVKSGWFGFSLRPRFRLRQQRIGQNSTARFFE